MVGGRWFLDVIYRCVCCGRFGDVLVCGLVRGSSVSWGLCACSKACSHHRLYFLGMFHGRITFPFVSSCRQHIKVVLFGSFGNCDIIRRGWLFLSNVGCVLLEEDIVCVRDLAD